MAYGAFARCPGFGEGGGSQNVHAHEFRDLAPERRVQGGHHSKVRCPSCGCWATRGAACYFCGTAAPCDPHTRRAHEIISRAPGYGEGGGGAANVHSHKFRDVSAEKQHRKVRCPSCGCWATRGSSCYHCGDSVPADPGMRRAHEIIQRTPGFGEGGGDQNVHSHKFRDAAPEQKHTKVRCPSCGCWSTRGASCYWCRQRGREEPMPCAPGGRRAHEIIQRAPGFGEGDQTLNVHAHKFREPAEEKKHTKVRCPSCGCWDTRGASCYHCGTPMPTTPNSRSAHEIIQRAPGFGEGGGDRNVHNHKFRETVVEKRHTKARCPSCGCWASRGSSCYQCGHPVPSDPGMRRAHEHIARAPGFGDGAGSRTVHDHSFRDRSPEKVHTKVKCRGCGCWGYRGGVCDVCGIDMPVSGAVGTWHPAGHPTRSRFAAPPPPASRSRGSRRAASADAPRQRASGTSGHSGYSEQASVSDGGSRVRSHSADYGQSHGDYWPDPAVPGRRGPQVAQTRASRLRQQQRQREGLSGASGRERARPQREHYFDETYVSDPVGQNLRNGWGHDRTPPRRREDEVSAGRVSASAHLRPEAPPPLDEVVMPRPVSPHLDWTDDGDSQRGDAAPQRAAQPNGGSGERGAAVQRKQSSSLGRRGPRASVSGPPAGERMVCELRLP